MSWASSWIDSHTDITILHYISFGELAMVNAVPSICGAGFYVLIAAVWQCESVSFDLAIVGFPILDLMLSHVSQQMFEMNKRRFI